ncbi:MAG: ECF-type sigma factor [Steroidobacteraceae bacterium]
MQDAATFLAQEAVASIVDAFERNKGFFISRIPALCQQLEYLVRRCRQLRHTGLQLQGQSLLTEQLFCLFGVRVEVPANRQLSVLAALLRHTLMVGVSLRQPPPPHSMRSTSMLDWQDDGDLTMLALDGKLNELSHCFPACVRIVELRYFARLKLRDIAAELEQPVIAVTRDLRFAEAWLLSRMEPEQVWV